MRNDPNLYPMKRIFMKIKMVLLIFVLVFVPLLLRLYYLTADLPSGYQTGTYNADEGTWMHNARNKILFGKWVMENDEWNPLFVTPLYLFSMYLFFYIFGVSIVVARLMSVFYSVISITLFYKTLKNEFNKNVAFVGTFLLSYNFIYLIFSRAAMLEIFSIFLLILTFYFFQKSVKKPKLLVLVGVTSFLSFLAKASNVPFFFVVFFSVFFLVYEPLKKKDFRRIFIVYSYLFFGWVMTFFVYLFTFFIPFYHYVRFILIERYILPQVNPIPFFLKIFKMLTIGFDTPFFVRMPIVSITAFIYFIFVVRELFQKDHSIKPTNFFVLNWIIFTFVYLFFQRGTALRRMVQMIPALVFLSAQLLSNFKFNSVNFKLMNKKSKIIIFVLYFVLFYNIIANLLKYGFFNHTYFLVDETTNLLKNFNLLMFSFNAVTTLLSLIFSLIIACIIFSVYFIFHTRIKLVFFDISRFIGKRRETFLIFTLMLVFLISFFQYNSLVIKADNSYYRASLDLGEILNNEKIQGHLSISFTSENQNVPLYIEPGFVNYNNRFNRSDVEYFMLVLRRDYGNNLIQEEENKEWLTHYPNSTLVWAYNLSDREYSLVGLFKKNLRK